DHDHHSHELDEHVWTDPANAIKIVKKLTKVLSELDPANADFYQENSEKYTAKLAKLDQDYKEMVANAKRDTIIVGDRFPFRYLVEAYGLKYFAAFPGCSTEGDASPQTLVFLIDKVKEEQIPVVFHIEMSNMKMAESIADATGAEIMLLHGAHNISKEDFENGLSYLAIMSNNLENLRHALND
ncbi:MAG: metal ABC transporter substrate-binding protein, partial [Eubacteriales bacterium]|nr:metal ABC transporter substrate-binding protein [Eubacteriales bacterium]